MTHRAAHIDELPFAERPYRPQDAVRHAASLTDVLDLEGSRASLWRCPPGARGRRHREGAQEEVFAVLQGALTIAVGDEPPEMVHVPAVGFVRISAGTPLQIRNEGAEEALVLIWGAPPVTGGGEFLDDLP